MSATDSLFPARDLLLLIQDGFTTTRAMADVLGIANAHALTTSMKSLQLEGHVVSRKMKDGTTNIWALTEDGRAVIDRG